ncbi:MAG: hypothetical protein LBT66_07600 [Methanobrevibacter sp.]|jgi:hypothetical protein|nr:hypothetical protein [Candidatus Methanovirga meridionalis]
MMGYDDIIEDYSNIMLEDYSNIDSTNSNTIHVLYEKPEKSIEFISYERLNLSHTLNELLEYCKNIMLKKEKLIPTNTNRSGTIDILNKYKNELLKNEAENEAYLISELEDILDYCFESDNFNPSKDNIVLITKIIEVNLNFIKNKTNLIKKYPNNNENFINEYTKLLEDHCKILDKYESQFYTKIYIPTGKHEATINSIYDVMKEDFIKG